MVLPNNQSRDCSFSEKYFPMGTRGLASSFSSWNCSNQTIPWHDHASLPPGTTCTTQKDMLLFSINYSNLRAAQSILVSKESCNAGGFLVFNDQSSLPSACYEPYRISRTTGTGKVCNPLSYSWPLNQQSNKGNIMWTIPPHALDHWTNSWLYLLMKQEIVRTKDLMKEGRNILFGPKASRKGSGFLPVPKKTL